jgi:3',5'-cyclic AMP phosphodiesterase CpdA
MTANLLGPSRRGFLSAAAAASVTFSLPLTSRAKAASRKSLRLAVVTDTHLGFKDQNAAEQLWSQTAEEIAGVNADLVLHLGDLVDRGQESLYPRYLKRRESIKLPIHEIPGNHDPQELFEKYIRQPVDTVVDCDWLRLVLLNNSRTDSHDGFLTEQQLTWIDEQLADAEERNLLAILCMHVPAHANKHPDRGWHIKPEQGQPELYRAIDRRPGTVLAMFHGHFHNGLRGWDDAAPVHEICFPSALYNQDRKLSEGGASGYNLNEFRAAYSVVTIGDEALQIALHVVGQGNVATKELD